MKHPEWTELASLACQDAGTEPERIEIITTWEQTFSDNDVLRNNAVFRVDGDTILKLYGTDAHRHARVEAVALRSLAGVLPIPQLIAQGQLDTGTPYVIMTAVAGQTLQDAWSGLSRAKLLNIAADIGRMTADLHRHPVGALAAVEADHGGRRQLIEDEQATRVAEISEMADLSPQHRVELLAYTQEEATTVANYPAVLTHSDLSHAHIYIDRSGDAPIVSGLIDWAEAMVGPAEWDLAFHWLWTFSRDEAAMRACLDAYYAGRTPPVDLARRCFSAHYFTYSMTEGWDYVNVTTGSGQSIVDALIGQLFPADVFGEAD